MGHLCRICGKIKSNESFSGKGHKNHICKKCAQRPKNEITAIDQQEEICKWRYQVRSYAGKDEVRDVNHLLQGGEMIEVRRLPFRALSIPGHTPHGI